MHNRIGLAFFHVYTRINHAIFQWFALQSIWINDTGVDNAFYVSLLMMWVLPIKRQIQKEPDMENWMRKIGSDAYVSNHILI